MAEGSKMKWLLDMARPEDKKLQDVHIRLGRKKAYMFNQTIVWDDDVSPTLTAGTVPFRGYDKKSMSVDDIRLVQTFPLDYDFGKNTAAQAEYVCGMSVPPNMMAHIAHQIWMQWLRHEKK